LSDSPNTIQQGAPPGVDFDQKWYVMVTVSVGILLATIDGSIVNVAMPTLVNFFDTSFATIQWVALAYLLTLATLTLLVGRIGDIVGKRRIYNAGFMAFTLASVVCAFAPTVGFLIAFRVVQAIGATMVLALGISILTESFPATERGKALGYIGTAVSIGVVTGPVVGGVLIEAFDWRAIFLVNLPVGIIGTFLAVRFVPDVPPVPGQKMDFWGAGLLSVGLLSLSLALTLGQSKGFADPVILALFALSIFAASVFVGVELRTRSPMIQLRLFQNPLLSVSVVSGFLVFAAVSATFFLLPFYLEGVLGYGVGQVGLLLGVGPLALGAVAPISGTLSDRIGVRSLTLGGLFVLTASYLAFQFLSTETRWWQYVLIAIPLGAGIGVFQSPNNSAIMGSIPREYSGVGGGLLNLTRLLGQITGVAVLGSIWASRVLALSSEPVPGNDASVAAPVVQVSSLHFTFAVAAALIGSAGLIGLWALRKERAGRAAARSASVV
jgi:EmrB/QacA subfamily drug resistance transporter